MFTSDSPLTFREFVTHEDTPLAVVFREVLEFVAGRSDTVLFGAHAVNAYCEPERMTHDVDLLSTVAKEFAERLCEHLSRKLRIATRVREVVPGLGYRVYQVRKPVNRQLVDVRHAAHLPAVRRFGGVQVIAPPELVAMKTISMVRRSGRPKAGTDLVDVQRMLLAFPELKAPEGVVLDQLRQMGAEASVLARWQEIAISHIEPDEDDGY